MIHNFSRYEVAAARTAARVLSEVADAHAKDVPDPDVICQWELQALHGLQAAGESLMLSFRCRLDAGASVETGPYSFEPFQDSADESRKAAGPAGSWNSQIGEIARAGAAGAAR